MALLFGTAGIPLQAKGQGTVAGIEMIRELGLDCMEIEFVRGVTMGLEIAGKVKGSKEQNKVELSVHAPYYINLNANEEGKRKASIKRIIDSARVGAAAGARNIVFHPGFYLGRPKEQVYKVMVETFKEISAILEDDGLDVTLRPETTGKHTQFGTLQELIDMSQEVEGVLPCVDFSHIHARTQRNNSREEFTTILARLEAGLGKGGVKDIHAHVSGIDYGKKGEKKHLMLQESDFRFKDLAKALKEYGAAGMVICESPNLETDAVMLKEAYRDA